MGSDKKEKKNVWVSIFRLVKQFKKGLITVFFISLVSTGVGLLEPLIYREAVNDVAGLYVQKARNDVKKEMGLESETANEPKLGFVKRKAEEKKLNADSLKKEKEKKPTIKKHRVKEPHRKDHVAPRTPYEAFNTLMWAVIYLFLINLAGLIFWWIGDNMDVKLSVKIERTFIQRTFAHVLKLPLAFFTKRSSSALHQQIDQSEEISETVTTLTKEIFPEIVSLVGILAIMLWQNYILTLIALSIIPFYLIITYISTKKLEKSLSAYYEKWEDVSGIMQDALTGIKTVKLSGAENWEVDRLNRRTQDAYNDYTKRSLLANKYAFWQVLLTYISEAAVLSYGGYLALNHELTPGDVVMFVAYLDMLYDPIDNLAEIWSGLQQNVASIARAFRLLDAGTEEKTGDELKIKKGKVEFKHVRFGYNPDREILKGISFKALPGQVTAIVGTSGAGKTTTVDLLLKLFDVDKGKILIDGQDMSKLEGSSVRRQIGMVSADGAIFRGTLADNIRYKKTDATDDEVYQAAIAAGMKSTLGRLPEGIQTGVGESGFGLSVGERQRVQIARVIVSKPAILILDEATANLDFATEAEVKKTIELIKKENTVIIIAHRFSMIKDADHVIVLDEGKIAEEGNPAELIANGGWFTDFSMAGEEDVEEENDEEEYEEDEDE